MRLIISILILFTLTIGHSAFACGVPPFLGHTGPDLTIGAGGVYERGAGMYADIGITSGGDPETLGGWHGYVGLHGMRSPNITQAFIMTGIAPSDRPLPYSRFVMVFQTGIGYANVLQKNSVAGMMEGKARFCPNRIKNTCIDIGSEVMVSSQGASALLTFGFSFYAGSQLHDNKMRNDMGERNFAIHEAIWNY